MSISRVGLALLLVVAVCLGWFSASAPGARREASLAVSPDCDTRAQVEGGVTSSRGWPRARTRTPARAQGHVDALPVVVLDDLSPAPPRPDGARDEAWAPGMERLVSDRVTPDFVQMFPNAKVEVTCATTTCDVEVEVDAGVRAKLVDFAAMAVALGPAYSLETRLVTEKRVTVAFVVDMSTVRDPEAWSDWYRLVEASTDQRVQEILRREQRGEPWLDVP